MKTMGLIGGMSWESTQVYYRRINQAVNRRLGGLHSARLILNSVDFAEIESLQRRDQWSAAADCLSEAARSVERAGADFVVLCTNTMHRIAPEIEQALTIPLLHIADTTASELKRQGVSRVGLLGTRFTMEQPFYRERLMASGVDVLLPEPQQRALVHDVIYQELCQGRFRETSKTAYLDIVSSMAAAGAQGVVLGCTEIGLLIDASDTDVPLFDTTVLHAEAAVRYALGLDGCLAPSPSE